MRLPPGKSVRRMTWAMPTLPALLLQACGAGWHRTDIVTPESPRQQVEIWQGQSAQRWHAVRVTDSTVTGIPFIRPIDCDSCRSTVPRASVDSIRLGNPSLGLLKTVGLVLLTPVVLMYGYCAVQNVSCDLGALGRD